MAFIVALFSKESKTTVVFVFMTIAILFLGAKLIDNSHNYKQGQIDAINGKYKYKQSIRYKFEDGVYISVDTIYVKIKN